MAGIMCAIAGGGSGAALVVTVGTDGFFDPKSGTSGSQYGYANAANAISGSTIGSILPTTFRGATINGLFFRDDGTTGGLKFILNGNQTALSVTQAIINGVTYTFGAASFSGGQTTWSSGASVGNGWGGSPATASIS